MAELPTRGGGSIQSLRHRSFCGLNPLFKQNQRMLQKNEGLNFYIILLHKENQRIFKKEGTDLSDHLLQTFLFMDEKTKAVKERIAHNREELVATLRQKL